LNRRVGVPQRRYAKLKKRETFCSFMNSKFGYTS